MTIDSLFNCWIGSLYLEIIFIDPESEVTEELTFEEYANGDAEYAWGDYRVDGIKIDPRVESITIYAGAEARNADSKPFTVREFVRNANPGNVEVEIWDVEPNTLDSYNEEITNLQKLKSGKQEYDWLNQKFYGWSIEDGVLMIRTEYEA